MPTGRYGRRITGAFLAVLVSIGTIAGAPSPANAKAEPQYESTIRLTVADLQDYWAEAMPAVYGIAYTPIPASHVIAITSKSKLPHCGPVKLTYRDIEENAFYCKPDNFLVYDNERLFPQLAAAYGDFTVALTLAHEWGHAIQNQAGLDGPSITLEQQADCFAGAWVQRVADGDSPRLSLRSGNLDAGLAGFLTFRDPPGTNPAEEGSHGSAFDRIGAFQEGYEGGAARCAAFEGDAPPLTDLPFSNATDKREGGNLPYRDVIPATAADLDVYWSGLLDNYVSVAHITPYDPERKLPVCDGVRLSHADAVNGIAYCPQTNTIAYDHRLLPGVYERSGDFGVAVVIAAEWAVAMQHLEGVTGDAKARELQQSCFTGSWAGSVARGDHDPDGTGLTLSAGDLDEAVESFLIFRDQDKISAGTGATAFENVEAFRNGFLQGEQVCVDLA